MNKKKWKRLGILALLLAGVAGGGTAAIKYVADNRGGAAEVFSVASLNSADFVYYGDVGERSGTITTDVSQSVYVPEGKSIAQVYVQPGDTVKVGDKLLDYDTTILELDKELKELNIKAIELQKKSVEADLNKLKSSGAVPRSAIEGENTYDPSIYQGEDSESAGLSVNMEILRTSQDAGVVPAEGVAADSSLQGGTAAPDGILQEEPGENGGEENAASESSGTDSGASENRSSENGSAGSLVSGEENQGQHYVDPDGLLEDPDRENSGQNPSNGSSGQKQEFLDPDGIEDSASGQEDYQDIMAEDASGEGQMTVKDPMKLWNYLRITDGGQQILLDSRNGAADTVQVPENGIWMECHFKEKEKLQFGTKGSYVFRVSGLAPAENRTGRILASVNPESGAYMEIGAYVLEPRTDGGAKLTFRFREGLEKLRKQQGGLGDICISFSCKREEITTGTAALTDATGKIKLSVTVEGGNSSVSPETETGETAENMAGTENGQMSESVAGGTTETGQTSESVAGGTTETGQMSESVAGGTTETGQTSESVAGGETETEQKSENAVGTENGNGTEPENETEPESGSETESESGTEPESGSETESESGTEPESETEPESGFVETESETEKKDEILETESEEPQQQREMKVQVHWDHKSNAGQRPERLEIKFYASADAQEPEFMEVINRPTSTQQSGTTDPTQQPGTTDSTQQPDATDPTQQPGTANPTPQPGTTVSTTEDWGEMTLLWPEGRKAPGEYIMLVMVEHYLPQITWEPGTGTQPGTLSIRLTYYEPGPSPVDKLEPLERLDYASGAEEGYYKGSGTKEDPFVFFCKDGVYIENTFINWVLGFDEEGKVRVQDEDGPRKGYYIVLELREQDEITGAFIRSVGLNGTVEREEGYGPRVYWIFDSENGIVKHELEEPEPGGGGGDDPGWDDIGDYYTAEERAEAIQQKGWELRQLENGEKEARLELKEYEKQLKESTVTSAVDGYVVSIGGETEGDAYMVLKNQNGYYVKSTVSELDLSSLQKGQQVLCNSWETGAQFNATITDISYYPSQSAEYVYGSNNNASSYPVLALLEDYEPASEYEFIGVKFSSTEQTTEGKLYIDKGYIRSENGRRFVYKMGTDQRLCRQYVRTGQTISGYVEIKEGLSTEDWIAFPYTKAAREGAKTKTQADQNLDF